jgi:hypothetical protein
MDQLEQILEQLTRKYLQVEIAVGYGDAINGYGWHAMYFFRVYKTTVFCPKCKRLHGYNLIDYRHDFEQGYHRHSYENNLEQIKHEGPFHSYQQMIMAISEFEKSVGKRDYAGYQWTKYNEIASEVPFYAGNEHIAWAYRIQQLKEEELIKAEEKKQERLRVLALKKSAKVNKATY